MNGIAKKISEEDYLEYVAKEDFQSFAFQLIDKVLEQTDATISNNYIKSQILPNALQFVKDTCERHVDWYFCKRDNGEVSEQSWTPDVEPEPCPMDSWTANVLPTFSAASVIAHPGIVYSKKSLLVAPSSRSPGEQVNAKSTNYTKAEPCPSASNASPLKASDTTLGGALGSSVRSAAASAQGDASSSAFIRDLPEIEEEVRLNSVLPNQQFGSKGRLNQSNDGKAPGDVSKQKSGTGRNLAKSSAGFDLSASQNAFGSTAKFRNTSACPESSSGSLNSYTFRGKTLMRSSANNDAFVDKAQIRRRERELSIFEENKKLLSRIPVDSQKERKNNLGFNFDHSGRIILTRVPGHSKTQSTMVTSKLLPITLSTGKSQADDILQSDAAGDDDKSSSLQLSDDNLDAVNSRANSNNFAFPVQRRV